MFRKNKDLKLTDLVDIKFLQKFQDEFSKFTGISSLTYGKVDPITEPSDFVEICSKYIKSNELGRTRCQECDLKWAKIAADQNAPVVYKCHAGITDFAVPIVVGGQHIASIYGGQILTEEPDEEFARETAKQLGLDEDEYVASMRKLKVIPMLQLQTAVDFLSIVANSISQIAYKNLMLNKKNKMGSFYKKIVKAIRSSLYIEETKQSIVDIIRETLNVDRCFMVKYDPVKDEFGTVVNEALASDNIESYKGKNVNILFPNFVEVIKGGENISIDNKEICINKEVRNYYVERDTIEEHEIYSAFAFPICHSGELLGALSISYVKSQHEIGDDEIGLLNMIADQVGVALYQAKLYETEQIVSKREQILRETIDILRSQSSIAEIKKTFVEIIANYFKPDRCIFADYDEQFKVFLPISIEIVGKSDILSIKGVSLEADYPEFCARVKRGKDIFIKDMEKLLSRIKPMTKSIDNSHFSGTKSDYGFVVKHKSRFFGVFVMHYVEDKKVFTKDELIFLKSLTDQAEIALYQADLLEKEKKTAQRERLLRVIAEKMRSSLDIEETLAFICQETAKLFNVQRVAISSFPNSDNYQLSVLRKEYKVSDEMTSIANVPEVSNVTLFWNTNVITKNDTLGFDDIQESTVPDFFKNTYQAMGVRSIIGTPVKKGTKTWGILVLSEYNKKRHWTIEEKDLLKAIADEVFIAVNQAELFAKEKINAKREKLINNIFIKMLSTFAINEIRHIVTDIGVMTKADRCYFVEAEPEFLKGKPVDLNGEYLSSPDIKSIVGEEFSVEDNRKYVELYLEKRDIQLFDYEDIQKNAGPEYEGMKKYSQKFNLKSGIGIPFFYMDKLLAVLCIEYVKEKVLPTEEEFDFLRILGNQIGIAFHQIINYQKTKETAEREIILRKIIETVRSSLDINEVKKRIVNELGVVFGADRCYFRSYDRVNGLILPPDVEYLSSDEIPSLRNVEVDQYALKYFVDEVIQRKKGFYPTVVNEEFAKGTPVETYMKMHNIKADYAIPIVDRSDELTWLVLHYSKADPKLSEEYMRLLETIAYQIDIAFEQIKLYHLAEKTAEREGLLRKTFETMRSSLDINNIKTSIVAEVCNVLKADRCFIMEYDKDNDKFLVVSDEYLASSDIPSFKGTDVNKELPNFTEAIKKGKNIIINNKKILMDNDVQYENFEVEKNSIDKYKINSAFTFPLYYSKTLLGAMSVHYVGKEHTIIDEEIKLLDIITNQIAIAIYQAKLFKITQMQAEREKISRNIIEILRSSMDEKTIKKLFVKNIGKYFKANRVFFSDYDQESNTYLPIDSNSEYLSGPEEKSFVDFDFSNESLRGFIQPLMEKREVKIQSWDEYIQGKPKTDVLITRFENAQVKSSYNLPVLYQQKIMGYFCIEFTHEVTKLVDEDINRIRSICTQAGIALYQAELYQKAHDADVEKGELIENISRKLKDPLINIIEIAERLPREVDNCSKQIDDLNDISKNGKKLLDLSSYIEKMSSRDIYNDNA